MGKSKKNRGEQETAAETKAEVDVSSSDTEEPPQVQKKSGKAASNTSKERKAADDDSKVVKGVKNLKIASDDSDEEEKVTVKQSAFALLDIESGEDSASSDHDDEDVKVKKSVKQVEKKQPVKKQTSKKENDEKPAPKGKKKEKTKQRTQSDEDLDKILAEMKAEYEEEEKPDSKKKEKKKGKDSGKSEDPQPELVIAPTPVQDEPKSKTKQKKKDKKEKETTPVPVALADNPTEAPKEEAKSKKKGDKKEDVDEKPADGADVGGKNKKKPNKAMVAIMQERLKLIKEEEERQKREEEEKQRLLEEADRLKEEKRREEEEKKERKKQKEKERKERLKAEGKLLTGKQKADRARAAAMLEALKAQGLDVPLPGEKRHRPGTRIRPKKNQTQDEEAAEEKSSEQETPSQEATPQPEETTEPKDDVKDAWDAESDSDGDFVKVDAKEVEAEKEESEEESESEEDESEEESDDSEEQEEHDDRPEAEKMRERALMRIAKRSEEAEKNKNPDILRSAVVCVLGHVDTGKTKILDKLRRTNVQDGEAGGITQQIGATNVPVENIKEQTKFIKGYSDVEFKLPGLLIIDTPGHESFSNLRSRGSSLCDIAILVVDIMHGLEPQTIESINLLKQRKTPFLVALNKIDRLYDWQTFNRKDVRDILKSQAPNTVREFEKRTSEIVVQFAEQGLNAALFYENPDLRSYISLVPTSAITGEGMGNLLFLIIQFCQNQLAKRLMYSEELQATVLEVKAIGGLGTTIDCILVNGRLREGQTMILAGTDGPIQTQVKALLMPQPMKELRVKNQYIEHKEVVAAQGVKIAAKELEKAIAGLSLYIAHKSDEIEIYKERVARDLRSVLSSIKLSERGVFVQASTLGSLEALLQFLKDSKIPYAGIRIGPVVKKDVMKASIMLEHDSQYATILAFDVKVERDAQDLADHMGVKIFQADIIYHLFDQFTAYRDELKQRKRDEFKSVAVFPCKIRVLPQFVFNSRDPIVVGVMIEAGIVKEGTPLCVPTKDFVEIGIVTSIESNHKQIESARKGQEVCLKIESLPGESPKMFGRHFDETDFLVSKITRQSIDACKDYFRDDLLKSDWALMVELKKTFQIL